MIAIELLAGYIRQPVEIELPLLCECAQRCAVRFGQWQVSDEQQMGLQAAQGGHMCPRRRGAMPYERLSDRGKHAWQMARRLLQPQWDDEQAVRRKTLQSKR